MPIYVTAEEKLRDLAAADATMQSFFGTNPFRYFDTQQVPQYIAQGTCVRVLRVSTMRPYSMGGIQNLSQPRFQFDVLDYDAQTTRQAAAALIDWLGTVDLANPGAIPTPAQPVVTAMGVTGFCNYSYVLVARNAVGTTPYSHPGTTIFGPCTPPDVTSFNRVDTIVATGVSSYDVWRSDSESMPDVPLGFIGNVLPGVSFFDTGQAPTLPLSDLPTINTTAAPVQFPCFVLNQRGGMEPGTTTPVFVQSIDVRMFNLES